MLQHERYSRARSLSTALRGQLLCQRLTSGCCLRTDTPTCSSDGPYHPVGTWSCRIPPFAMICEDISPSASTAGWGLLSIDVLCKLMNSYQARAHRNPQVSSWLYDLRCHLRPPASVLSEHLRQLAGHALQPVCQPARRPVRRHRLLLLCLSQ